MNVQVELKISAVIEIMTARDCTGPVLLTGPTGGWRMRMAVMPWFMTLVSPLVSSDHFLSVAIDSGNRAFFLKFFLEMKFS